MTGLHALRPGATAALGAPALAMGATFLAFGAAVAAAGLGLGWALGASLFVYGMAGQLVLLQAGAAGVVPAALGATAANARFLPMALALAPWLGRGRRRWLALPFIAITLGRRHAGAAAFGGAATAALVPRLRPGLLGVAGLATAIGHWAAPSLSPLVLAALLFTNPLYFALLLAADLRLEGPRRAILAGVLAAPAALLLPPAWGLLTAGLLGGTLAFLIGRRHARR
ncbi:AzlC family ABC transporter permease [Paeniroseomonas aquatica]|uniref:AzlC family ABC transporter permease n=1 Tax=Paeniroseomonas aquatica TaxID=373043 RepID=UPI0036225E10